MHAEAASRTREVRRVHRSLAVRNGAITQHTVLDPHEVPATFDDLVSTLREVLKRELAN
jgi:hypothetical protein